MYNNKTNKKEGIRLVRLLELEEGSLFIDLLKALGEVLDIIIICFKRINGCYISDAMRQHDAQGNQHVCSVYILQIYANLSSEWYTLSTKGAYCKDAWDFHTKTSLQSRKLVCVVLCNHPLG